MKIMYHIAQNWTDDKIQIMNQYGLSPKKGYTSFQLEEKEFFDLKKVLNEWGVSGVKYPLFTKKELKESLLSAKNGSHEHGYPMPDKQHQVC
jgi:hypothetical protein